MKTEVSSPPVSLEKITVAVRDEKGESINGIELNIVTLLTGKNGTGKSFYLVSSYVISEIASIVPIGLPEEILYQSAEFIINGSYHSMLNGRITGYFDNGLELVVHIKDGKVTNIERAGWDDVENVRTVRYLSAGMRTFVSIKQYLFARKLLMSSKTHDEAFAELCKNFKLYDVKHIESLIARMPVKIDDRTNEAFKNFDIQENIEYFDVDLENSDFFYEEKETKKKVYMTTLGSGHQSIFNMVISQL
jgi:hypothetical protein